MNTVACIKVAYWLLKQVFTTITTWAGVPTYKSCSSLIRLSILPLVVKAVVTTVYTVHSSQRPLLKKGGKAGIKHSTSSGCAKAFAVNGPSGLQWLFDCLVQNGWGSMWLALAVLSGVLCYFTWQSAISRVSYLLRLTTFYYQCVEGQL